MMRNKRSAFSTAFQGHWKWIAASMITMLFMACLMGVTQGFSKDEDQFLRRRGRMIKAIEADVNRTSRWIGKNSLKQGVMDAMARVPRHEFVSADERPYAYNNRPLPIGHGQTISQPYIVALMTDLLAVDAQSRVLEIGTGSGYQTAVLAEIVEKVYTIEIIDELGKTAEQRLKRLGYGNVQVRLGDGYYGWKDHAPFDGIIVTAAASHVPPPLIQQLKPGARMIIPVGNPFATQQLVLVEKKGEKITTRQVLPVRFVPLTGGH